MKYFCCSDIHGFMDPFFTALINSGFDNYNADHVLIVCGDAFDRGKDAVRVYKYLKELHSKDRLIYIKGNHEDLIFDCVQQLRENDGCAQSHHYSNGTVNTVVQLMEADILDEVLDFINAVCVDYFEVDDHVFVHGWIPVDIDDWRNASIKNWEAARWINGMDAWCRKRRLDDKVIVCGHWHTGWGHFNLHNEGETQFDNFKIFEDNGIVALDACTVYSNKVNFYVIEK